MTNDPDLAISRFVTPVDLVFVRKINVMQITHYIRKDTVLYDNNTNAQNRSICSHETSNALAWVLQNRDTIA